MTVAKKRFTMADDNVLRGLKLDYLTAPHDTQLLGVIGDRLEDLGRDKLCRSVRAVQKMHDEVKSLPPFTSPTGYQETLYTWQRVLRRRPWVSHTVFGRPTMLLLWRALYLRYAWLAAPKGARFFRSPVFSGSRHASVLVGEDLRLLAFGDLLCTGLLGTAASCRAELQELTLEAQTVHRPHLAEARIVPRCYAHDIFLGGRFSERTFVHGVCALLGLNSIHNFTGKSQSNWLCAAANLVATVAANSRVSLLDGSEAQIDV